MNTPKKCGKMYIKFDDKNQPEYGFVVSGNRIQKFIPLTDNDSIYVSIILPKLIESAEPEIKSIDESNPHKSMLYMQKQKLEDYVVGKVKICDGCFEGIKKARIIVPFENSIMLDWGSFDKDADIELVMSKNLDLKQIYRRFDTGYDYERENWTIIGDKNISGQFGNGTYGSDQFSIVDYNEEDLDYKVANFTIKHLVELKDKSRKKDSEDLVK